MQWVSERYKIFKCNQSVKLLDIPDRQILYIEGQYVISVKYQWQWIHNAHAMVILIYLVVHCKVDYNETH